MKTDEHKKNTKIIIDCIKRLPLERPSLLDAKWKLMTEYLTKTIGEDFNKAPYSEFITDLRRVFRFSDDL